MNGCPSCPDCYMLLFFLFKCDFSFSDEFPAFLKILVHVSILLESLFNVSTIESFMNVLMQVNGSSLSLCCERS